MNKYEAVYIIDTAVEESARKELVTKFNDLVTANGGAIEKVDEWGKRRLAYTIDDKNEGYYVLMHFSSEANLPHELERNLQINENILRYLVIKLEQKRTSVKPRPVSSRPIPTTFAPPEPVEAAPAAPAVAEAAAPAVEAVAEAAAPVVEAVAEVAPVAEAAVEAAAPVVEAAQEAVATEEA